jgi:hypothetical protein
MVQNVLDFSNEAIGLAWIEQHEKRQKDAGFGGSEPFRQ